MGESLALDLVQNGGMNNLVYRISCEKPIKFHQRLTEKKKRERERDRRRRLEGREEEEVEEEVG